ncbi:MAG TPA: hypothetical protein VGJ81_06745 [Thermoanaerobaculia bacterium]|jgi:hypothetical protein
MTLIDDLRAELAERLQTRVLVVFGRAIDRVEVVEVEGDLLRVPPLGVDAARLMAGMQLPQLVASVTVEKDGSIEFHLDRELLQYVAASSKRR